MQSVTELCAGRPAPGIRAALGLVGFSAVIGQIVLMRELIVVFNGNEISLGIMLGTWLLWTAVGSSLAGRLVSGLGRARTAVAMVECVVGISLLPTIWLLRFSRTFFQTVPGELIGPVSMLLTSLVCLSGFCVLSGGLFVLAARMYQEECTVSDRVASSSAYLLEAIGSGLGGILASVVLLRFLESLQIAILVALINVGMAVVLWLRLQRTKIVAVLMLGCLIAIPLLIYVAPPLNRSSQERLWRGFYLLGSRDSIYGNLAVIETGNIRSVYDNGVIFASAPDEAAAEEAVHYALLEHPAPANVLLIGGGVNGSIAQALKHPMLKRLDYVELDPALIEVTRDFFPETSAVFSDARVHVHYADGRRFLKTTHDRFDVIILDLPDPQTAQLNRFYTVEFFRSARDHLVAGGVLAVKLRSSEDYISPDLAEFLRCIHRTLGQVFPYIAVIPGETMHFFGAMQPNVLTEDSRTLIARLRQRNVQTQYVREYFIPFRMMPDRMAQVRQLLQPVPTTPINRDFEPIAYYFNVVLWSSQFKFGYSSWFRNAAHFGFARIVNGAVVILLCAAVMAFYVPGERRSHGAAVFCVAASGFTLMALQVFLLLAFESVYGYVYHQLAILITMFMAGIGFGSWLGIRRIRSCEDPPLGRLASTQFLLAASAPVLMFLISVLSRTSATVAAQLFFPILAVFAGVLGGYQFPLATGIYLRAGKAGLGALYAIDLLGGCAGALLVSSYLIPVFGFWNTAWLSAAVNLAPAILAARVSRESRKSPA